MKTILAAVDFSDISKNSLDYAASLASFAKAKLVLFHSYHIPVSPGEVAMSVIISAEQLEKNERTELRKLEKKVKNKYSDVETEVVLRIGFAVDEILAYLTERKIDLVVMGVTGSGKSAHVLFGTTSTSLMKKTNTPVLIVPADAKFTKPESIVLACDYTAPIPEHIMNNIKSFTSLFGAKLHILDVLRPLEIVSSEKAAEGIKVENSLNNIQHILHFWENEDIITGINNFVDSHKTGWLIMIPHTHNAFAKIFHRSNTKRMAFHTHVPLLSLHE